MLHRNIARAPSVSAGKGQAARLSLADHVGLCSSSVHRAGARERMGDQMLEWMLMPIRRYADFKGRSRRKEFWLFQLLNFLVQVVLIGPLYYALISSMVAMRGMDESGNFESSAAGAMQWSDHPIAVGMAALGLLWGLFVLIPGIAVTVRRLHDIGRNGWWILIAFTIIGIIVLIVFYATDSEKATNQYGEYIAPTA